MTITQFIKIAKYIALTSGAIISVGLIYGINQSRDLSEKFKETEINISRELLIASWGKPDEEFDMNLNNHKMHFIKYTDLLGYGYIFTSKKNSEIISYKYIDD